MKRVWLATLLLAALPLLGLDAAITPAAAQKYPSRPIRVMLPFAPGSVSDVTLRIFADKLGARLNTSIIVDNQPRAGGVTAVTTTLSAPPDGYTLVTLSSSTAISVSLLKSLSYDPVNDFLPISGLSTFANIVATSKDSKYQTLADVIAAARAKPGTLNVGTTTVGATNNLAANLWRSMSKLDFVIVPFRTPAELVTAAIRGDVDVVIQSFGALKSPIQSGQLHALASTTGTRAAYAPDVPTMDEAGVKGFEVLTWNGFFAVKNTPPAIVELLNREMRAVLADSDLKQRFVNLGLEPLPTTPNELTKLLKDEVEKWRVVIDEAGIEKQ